MNIFIIGNGFDVANGLPTGYPKFLRMCELTMDSEIKFNYCPLLAEEDKKEFITFCTAILEDNYTEFAKIANDNLFVNHFLMKRDVIGDKWLNFEEEIEHFVKTLVRERNCARDEIVNKSELVSVQEFATARNLLGKITYKDLFQIIREEHKSLSRLLDIYMDGYINKHEIKKIPGYKKGFYDHALSFNYTSTFTEHYEPEIDCCYVHGKASINNKDASKLVLGFESKYMGSSEEYESYPFEKFFQRQYLNTSNDYLMWLDTLSKDGNIIDIYGHSLAQADAVILKDFITSPKVKTRIFYYNDSDKFDKMRNLAIVLGAKEFTRLVGSLFPSISFIHVKDYSASR